MTEVDLQIFEKLIPAGHYLRHARSVLDFDRFRERLASCYHPTLGRPGEDVVLLVKLEFLQYHDNLSDRQVIERAGTDVAYRYFLNLGLSDTLPDSSSLCYFRGRLGVEGHRAIFNEVVAQARDHGLVKDRLRLKDATHVIADVALPTTLALIAQVRNKLLAAAASFDAVRVEGERARTETIRQATGGRSDEERLTARVTHLREILAWVDAIPAAADGQDERWQTLLRIRQLAHKILAEQADPKARNRTRSTTDPDARRGKHGEYYDGYLLDVMMDADSEFITSVNVLPANGDEAADAPELIRQEEQAQRNDIQALSIDGAGFNGAVLRELENPAGLALDVYTPPKAEPVSSTFGPQDFTEDLQRGVVTCPAGQTSRYHERDAKDHATIYRFHRDTCTACPLLSRCMEQTPKAFGRSVRKNDYEAEYRRARAKARTEAFVAVRREHPKIERKLSELVRWHGCRFARYRGQAKVLAQQLSAAIAVNVKRMVKLLGAQPLRVEVAGTA